MTKSTIQTPVEVEVHAADYLPTARNDELMQELKRRLCDHVQIDKAQFLDLVDAIVEMRFTDTFTILENAAPTMVNVEGARQRQLEHILNKGNQQEEGAQ